MQDRRATGCRDESHIFVYDIFTHFPTFLSFESVDIIEKFIIFVNSFSSFLFMAASSKFVISSLFDNNMFLLFCSIKAFWTNESSDFKIDKFELYVIVLNLEIAKEVIIASKTIAIIISKREKLLILKPC